MTILTHEQQLEFRQALRDCELLSHKKLTIGISGELLKRLLHARLTKRHYIELTSLDRL